MTRWCAPRDGTLRPVFPGTIHRIPLRRLIAVAVCACIALAPASCSVAPKPTGTSRSAGAGANGAAFEPVELRIHPLTRVRESATSTGSSVDLYFELLDKWGHGVKALGTLTVELRAIGAGGQREPFQVRSWTVALSEPGVNSAAYDRVTRTYHIVLEDVPPGTTGSEVLARFRTTGSRQISATYDLR